MESYDKLFIIYSIARGTFIMSDRLVYKLFEYSRLSEVLFRKFISKHRRVKKFANDIFNRDKVVDKGLTLKKGQWEIFKKSIVRYGIKNGDVVLIHSSMFGLYSLGVSVDEILDFFEELIGREGTLIFPTYPDLERMKCENGVYLYDPKKTVPWTGALPKRFLRREGVIRSKFPHNTLAAKGKYAEEMMKKNLDGKVYSQGTDSSWEFAINHNVKILYLGVEAATSCTIVHYTEDQLADEWPIDKWYQEHKYRIVLDDGSSCLYTTKERDNNWFNYYCMYNTAYQLKKKGYLKEYDADGIYIGIMDNVKEMTDYLLNNARNNELLYRIPKKYFKRK